MSLLEEAYAEGRIKGPPCDVAVLDPALVAEIDEALADPTIYGTTVIRLLAQRGVKIGKESIWRHRKRGTADGCKCP